MSNYRNSVWGGAIVSCLVFIALFSLPFIFDNDSKKNNNRNNKEPHFTNATIDDISKQSFLDEKVPYVGMSEDDISKTLLGRYTSMEKCHDYDALRMDHRYKTYYWKNADNIIIFQATVKYSDTKNWYVADIVDDSGTNNAKAKETMPYVGMHVSDELKSRMVYHGATSIDGLSVTEYRYDVGDYTHIVYIDEDNYVKKVSTSVHGETLKKNRQS